MQTKYFLDIVLDKKLCQLVQVVLWEFWLVVII